MGKHRPFNLTAIWDFHGAPAHWRPRHLAIRRLISQREIRCAAANPAGKETPTSFRPLRSGACTHPPPPPAGAVASASVLYPLIAAVALPCTRDRNNAGGNSRDRRWSARQPPGPFYMTVHAVQEGSLPPRHCSEFGGAGRRGRARPRVTHVTLGPGPPLRHTLIKVRCLVSGLNVQPLRSGPLLASSMMLPSLPPVAWASGKAAEHQPVARKW